MRREIERGLLAMYKEALEALEKMEAALKLDLLLLELEKDVGLMDGIKLEDWKQ